MLFAFSGYCPIAFQNCTISHSLMSMDNPFLSFSFFWIIFFIVWSGMFPRWWTGLRNSGVGAEEKREWEGQGMPESGSTPVSIEQQMLEHCLIKEGPPSPRNRAHRQGSKSECDRHWEERASQGRFIQHSRTHWHLHRVELCSLSVSWLHSGE